MYIFTYLLLLPKENRYTYRSWRMHKVWGSESKMYEEYMKFGECQGNSCKYARIWHFCSWLTLATLLLIYITVCTSPLQLQHKLDSCIVQWPAVPLLLADPSLPSLGVIQFASLIEPVRSFGSSRSTQTKKYKTLIWSEL